MRRTVLKWTALVALVGVGVLIAGEPHFWKRYALQLLHASDDLPLSFYEPRALVAGVDAPPMPRVSPAQANIEPEALRAAASYARQQGSDALIVSRNGHIVFEQYWNDTAYDTLADSESFAAAVASLLVGVAISEGHIGTVEEPAANYLEEWRNDARSRIRIRDLLQMSSGLRPPGGGAHPWAEGTRERLAGARLPGMLSRPLTGRPGRDWVPQASDPQMVALLIERAAGMPYARFLSEKLWKRIEAADAYLWLDSENGTPHAECCLLARQGDWIRIAEVLVNDGVYLGHEIVRPGWVREMLAPAAGNKSFGLQVALGASWPRQLPGAQSAEPFAADDVFSLHGSGKDRLWLVPSLRLAVLRTGRGALPQDWDDSRIPNLVIRGVRDFAPAVSGAGTPDPSMLAPNH